MSAESRLTHAMIVVAVAQRARRLAGRAVAMFVLVALPPAVLAQSSTRVVSYRENASKTGTINGTRIVPPLAERWRIHLPLQFGSLPSLPIVADGRVFLLTPDIQPSGFSIVCYDALTGALVWGPVMLRSIKTTGYLCYDRGTLLVLSAEGTLRAYDGQTGQSRWLTELHDDVPYGFFSPPTVLAGIVYVVGGDSTHAVLTSTGQALWTSDHNGSAASCAVSPKGVFLLKACFQTTRLQRATGRLRWHVNFNCTGGGGDIPALYDGKLYLRDSIFPETPGKVLDPATGEVISACPGGTMPAFAGGRGYFVTADGILKAVDTSTGNVVWKFSGDGQIDTVPHVIDGLVYVGSATGVIYALDRDGNLLWSYPLGGPYLTRVDCCGLDYLDIAAWDGLLVLLVGDTLVGLESVTPQPGYDVVIEDDRTADWLAVNTTTGDFLTGGCASGATARGVGILSSVTAGDLRLKATGSVSVNARLNMGSHTGSAKVVIASSRTTLRIEDGNLLDSAIACP